MRLIELRIIFLIGLILPASMAQANEVDTYFGFATGYSVRQQPAPSNDHVDSAGKIYAGVRFLGPIGIEFAGYDLGRYENETLDVEAVGADMVFNYDYRGMSMFFKAGMVQWKETELATGKKTRDSDSTFGLGINLAVDRHVLFRTEIERFRKVGRDKTTNDPGTEMTLFSFGVYFRF